MERSAIRGCSRKITGRDGPRPHALDAHSTCNRHSSFQRKKTRMRCSAHAMTFTRAGSWNLARWRCWQRIRKRMLSSARHYSDGSDEGLRKQPRIARRPIRGYGLIPVVLPAFFAGGPPPDRSGHWNRSRHGICRDPFSIKKRRHDRRLFGRYRAMDRSHLLITS